MSHFEDDFRKDLVRVKITGKKDPQQMLYMPDGTLIKGVVFTRVYDGVDDIPYVIAKLFVELDPGN
jgi:hypothetical protein